MIKKQKKQRYLFSRCSFFKCTAALGALDAVNAFEVNSGRIYPAFNNTIQANGTISV